MIASATFCMIPSGLSLRKRLQIFKVLQLNGREMGCGPNATNPAKQTRAGNALFDTGDSPCRFSR
jgi:hypothetical protein